MGTNGAGHHSTQYWDEDVTGHEGVAWRSPSKGGGRLGGGWSLWVEGRGRMRKGTKQEGQDVLGAEQWRGGGSRCCEDCPQMASTPPPHRWHRPTGPERGGAVSFSGLVFHPRASGCSQWSLARCPRASHLSEQLLALHWAVPAGPPAPPPPSPRRHMHRPDLTDAARNDPQLPANSIHFNDKQLPGGGRRPRPEMLQEAYPTAPSEVRPPRSPDISGFPPVTST